MADLQPNQTSQNHQVQYDQSHPDTDNEMIDPVELAIALMNDDARRQNATTLRNSALAASAAMVTGNDGNNAAGLTVLALGAAANTPDDGAREFVELMLEEPSQMTRREFLEKYRDWKLNYEEAKREEQKKTMTSLLRALAGVFLAVMIVLLFVLACMVP